MKLLLSLLMLLLLACVIPAAAQSTLTPQQLDTLKTIKTDADKNSVPYALKLAETAKRIYENMLSEKEDQKLRRKLNKELHYNAGKLLDIRGQSYRDALAVLTHEQRGLVRAELHKPGAPLDIGDIITNIFGLKSK